MHRISGIWGRGLNHNPSASVRWRSQLEPEYREDAQAALFLKGVRPLLYQRPSASAPGSLSTSPRRPVPGLVVGSGRRTTLRKHAGNEHHIEANHPACPPSQSGYEGAGGLRGAAGVSYGSHLMLARVSGSEMPMPVAGHSLRPSRQSCSAREMQDGSTRS